MSDDPAYIRDFKKYARSDPTIKDLDVLEKELYGANDRAVAIMLGAFMESALTKYLKTRFRQDMNSDERRAIYDYEGPLGTFSAKTSIAYAIHAIGPITRSDLDHIRIIRNEFAHSRKHMKFSDAETTAVCQHLQTPNLEDSQVPIKGFMTADEPEWGAYSDLTNPQNRYRSAVHTIAHKMLQVRGRFEMANALAKEALKRSDLP
jgi:DNA-binding MltR family transcriptional regulator